MRRTYVEDVTTRTPNFLVIGAAKSGTTALWHSLKQHPQIFMSPRKHTRFFSYDTENPSFYGPPPKSPSVPYAITDPDDYHAMFDAAATEKALGEASHSYLYRSAAPGRIRQYSPGIKLIAILRNPAERAFSHYRQMVRDQREPLHDFVRALEAEEARIGDNWWPDFHYVQMGRYATQLKRYLDLFDRDQIVVYLYEDFMTDPQGLLSSSFRFLGVDDSFVPVNLRYNASGIPKSETMHKALQKLRAAKPIAERYLPRRQAARLLRLGSTLHNRNLNRVRLTPAVRRHVIDEYFREEILELQDLVQRDLSAWLA